MTQVSTPACQQGSNAGVGVTSLSSLQVTTTTTTTTLQQQQQKQHQHALNERCDKRGAFTCDGWKVTLCDPIMASA